MHKQITKIKVELYTQMFIHNSRMLFDVFHSLLLISNHSNINTDFKPIYDLIYILEKSDMSNKDKYKHNIVNSFITFLNNNTYEIKSGQKYEENMWTTINKTPEDDLHNCLEIFIKQLRVKEKRALNGFTIFLLSLLEEIDEMKTLPCFECTSDESDESDEMCQY